MDALTKILVGAIAVLVSILLIKYVRWSTEKNQVTSIYDFNLYVASGIGFFIGLVLIYAGISNLISS